MAPKDRLASGDLHGVPMRIAYTLPEGILVKDPEGKLVFLPNKWKSLVKYRNKGKD